MKASFLSIIQNFRCLRSLNRNSLVIVFHRLDEEVRIGLERHGQGQRHNHRISEEVPSLEETIISAPCFWYRFSPTFGDIKVGTWRLG